MREKYRAWRSSPMPGIHSPRPCVRAKRENIAVRAYAINSGCATAPRWRKWHTNPQSHWTTTVRSTCRIPKCLMQNRQQRIGCPLDIIQARRQRRLADALQIASAPAEVGKFSKSLPGKTLLAPAPASGYRAAGRPAPARKSAQSRCHIMFGPMNSDTNRSTGIASGESLSSQRLADCSRNAVQRTLRRSNLINHLRQASSYRIEIRPCREEAGPVRCILNRIGKRDQLLVVVERAGPALLHHLLRPTLHFAHPAASAGICCRMPDRSGRAKCTGYATRGCCRAACRHPENIHQIAVPARHARHQGRLCRWPHWVHTRWAMPSHMRTLNPAGSIQAQRLRLPGEPGVVNLIEISR